MDFDVLSYDLWRELFKYLADVPMDFFCHHWFIGKLALVDFHPLNLIAVVAVHYASRLVNHVY